MAVNGVFASDANIQGNRKGDFAGMLLQKVPTGKAPMLALTAGMEEAPAHDSVVTWFEEQHLSGRVGAAAAAGANATAIRVDDASFIVPNQIFENEDTGEYVFVTAVNQGTKTLTVQRAFGGTTAVAILATHNFQLITAAQEQGSSRPTAVANLGEPIFNYMQIFRNAWNVTGTARAIEWYTGDIVAKNKRDAALFHSEDMERALIWGKKSWGLSNGHPFYTMGGIVSFISTNTMKQTTNTTWDNIETFLEKLFRFNIKGKPNERIAFCGNKVLTTLAKIARLDGDVNISPGVTEFGLAVFRWVTPFGNITLMSHPLMVENPKWSKNLLVVHPGAMRMRWLRRTSPDNYDRDGTRAGVDADFGVLTSEMTMEYHAEQTAGYYTGIDTAAKTS